MKKIIAALTAAALIHGIAAVIAALTLKDKDNSIANDKEQK